MTEAKTQGEKYHLLLIEDSEEDRYTYRRYLSAAETCQFAISEARAAKEALQILAAESIDCILLDYNLPGVDGFEFMAMLEKDYPAYAKIPVVVITGVKNKKVADAAIKFRIADYLLKSHLDKELLEKSVLSAIKSAKITDELDKHAELDEANESAKDEFYNKSNIRAESLMHVLSHELMTPIAAINVFAQVLTDRGKEYLKAEDLDYLKQISDYCIGLKDYLNDLLDIARIDSNKITLYQKSHSVDQLIDQVKAKIEPDILQKNLKFSVDKKDNLPNVNVDADRFVQIVENLVDNAIKFTDAGEVTVGAYTKNDDDKNVYFYVKDTGSGIPKHKQKYVFDRLYQIIKGDAGGLGLGLSIAYELALLHGGDIVLDSEEGKGSTFVVTIPRFIEQ